MSNYDQMVKNLDQLLLPFYKHLSATLSDKIVGGVTLSQLIILRQIALGVETVSELSVRLKITSAGVSKFVDQLTKLNMISRNRLEKDRRVSVLELTPQGRRVLKENLEVRHEIFKEIISSLTEEEISTLNVIIEKLKKRMKEDLI